MKRINLMYGGQPYSIGEADLDKVLAEIAEGVTSPEPRWLRVNHGEGSKREALLLLSAGVDIAVIPVPAIFDEPDQDSGEPPPPRAR